MTAGRVFRHDTPKPVNCDFDQPCTQCAIPERRNSRPPWLLFPRQMTLQLEWILRMPHPSGLHGPIVEHGESLS